MGRSKWGGKWQNNGKRRKMEFQRVSKLGKPITFFVQSAFTKHSQGVLGQASVSTSRDGCTDPGHVR